MTMSRATAIALFLTLGASTAGCSLLDAERDARATSSELSAWSPEAPRASGAQTFQVLKEEDRPHLGLTPVPSNRKGMPEEMNVEFTFPLGDRITHETIRTDLSQSLGLAIDLGPLEPVASTEAGGQGPRPPTGRTDFSWLGGESGGNIQITNWTGRVVDFLNAWTASAGYDWEWDNRRQTVVIYRTISRSWTVNALAGGLSWAMSVTSDASGGGSGGVSGGNSQSVSSTYEDNPWDEIRAQLAFAAKGEATLQLTPSTGRVTVTGTPGAVKRVEQALLQLNRTILRPVRLTFSMFRVEHNRQQSFDLGVAAVLRQVFGQALGVGLNNASGLVIRHPAHVTGRNSYSATVTALRRVGTVSRILSVDVPSLNGRPAQFYDLIDKAYVKEFNTTVQGEGATTSAEISPGTVSEGIMISYRAQILSHDELLARIAINILDSADIAEFSPSSDQTIQLPTQGRRAIVSSQSIRTGETLVLTGFADRLSEGDGDAGIGGESGTGIGDREARRRIEQVMLVTAEIGRPLGIVPENPVVRAGS